MKTSISTVAPSKADALRAKDLSRRLAGRRAGVKLQVLERGTSEAVTVPASALRMFVRLLTEMSLGNSVSLVAGTTELTTQQAADLLDVSRPFVVKLLDEGKIPFRTVGRFRRVRFDDVMAFKRRDDATRAKVLDQLTADAQELRMGY